MVDSKQKGTRAELLIRNRLIELSGLGWERTPGSGALDPKHMLKGDLYIPGQKNNYVVEVKHYAEDHLTSSILTNKSPQLFIWWEQALRQGNQVNQIPLLIFKFDRSKIFVAFSDFPCSNYNYILLNINKYEVYVALLDEWYQMEQPKFLT